MWQIILYAAISLAALYAFTATIFLFLTRLEKDADGKLVIDPDSWHFKVAYPIGRDELLKVLNPLKSDSVSEYERWQAVGALASYRKGFCAYFFKFFLMLYLGWPVFAVCLGICYAIFQIAALPFGFYMADITLDSITWKRYPLPRIYGVRTLPVYFIAMLGYATFWYFLPNDTLRLTGYTFGGGSIGVLAILIIWAAVSAISWFRHTDEKSVNVVREWVAAKKAGVCPTIEIKLPNA